MMQVFFYETSLTVKVFSGQHFSFIKCPATELYCFSCNTVHQDRFLERLGDWESITYRKKKTFKIKAYLGTSAAADR